jgi:hypothetical protein
VKAGTVTPGVDSRSIEEKAVKAPLFKKEKSGNGDHWVTIEVKAADAASPRV